MNWRVELEKLAAHYKDRLRDEASPQMRAIYLMHIRRLEKAIDRYALCMALELAAVRSRNLRHGGRT